MKTLKDDILSSLENIRMIRKLKKYNHLLNKLRKMRNKFETLDYSKEMKLNDIEMVVTEAKIEFNKTYIKIITDKSTNDPRLYSFIDDYTSTIIQSINHNRTSYNRCDYTTIHNIILGVTDILLNPTHIKYRNIFDEDFDKYEGVVLVFKELVYYQFYKNRKLFINKKGEKQ